MMKRGVQFGPKKWTLAKCILDAAKHSNKRSWSLVSSGYDAALRYGWMDICCAHMGLAKEPGRIWTLDACKADALKDTTRSAWKNRSPSAHGSARKHGWLDICCTHMVLGGNRYSKALYVFEYPDHSAYVGLTDNYDIRYRQHIQGDLKDKYLAGGQIFKTFGIFYPKEIASKKEIELIAEYRCAGWTVLNKNKGGALGGGASKWDLAACKIDARRFATRGAWRRVSNTAYQKARRKGWLSQCCEHMIPVKKPRGYWTRFRCLADAQRYNSRAEWDKKSKVAYRAAIKNDWLEECCAHMLSDRRPDGYWTIERCQEDARRYVTRWEWGRLGEGYWPAQRKGWLDLCCAHMPKHAQRLIST